MDKRRFCNTMAPYHDMGRDDIESDRFAAGPRIENRISARERDFTNNV